MTDAARQPFAKRSFGQNFLVDKSYIRKIVEALELRENEEVLEIGPGRGALSREIVEQGARLTAIELDRDMASVLHAEFAGNSNFRLIEADVLDVDLARLIESPPAKLVANLPYYISTPILRRLIEERWLFSRLVLMFQHEVAERIAAKPGKTERGFLTVLVEATMSVEKLFDVPPTAFRPVPKVWSSVVRLTPKPDVAFDLELFESVVSAAFGQKRKTILNNLKTRFEGSAELLAAAGVSPRLRAEALSLEQWNRLTAVIASSKS